MKFRLTQGVTPRVSGKEPTFPDMPREKKQKYQKDINSGKFNRIPVTVKLTGGWQ